MVEATLFYLFSGIAIFSALHVILQVRPTRALLSLIVTMFALAVLFILLGAPFIAMVHLIVYAGAVLVLFLFVIMLQGIGAKEIPLEERFGPIYLGTAIILGACLLGGLLIILSHVSIAPLQPVEGTAKAIGRLLFRQYVLPFELTSVLLLLGVFAAVALAKKESDA